MTTSMHRLVAWILGLISLVILPVSAILVVLHPTGQDERYLEILSGAIIGCGAPILGLVILRQQPRNRIGWLWLFVGLAISFFSLSYALKYQANSSPPSGYSSPLFSMLLFSETAYIIRFICLILLMLWFPDGQPPSPRWRFMHWWAAIAFITLIVGLFTEHVPWSDVEGIVGNAPSVENPIGFIPDRLTPMLNPLAPIGFLSIIAMMIIAALSIIIRYRSSNRQIQAQILWFVLGSVIYAISFVASIILINVQTELPGLLGNLAILPFYLAIGIAITRYHLYDIDVIIRRTLVYSLVTAILALVYYGCVTLLQAISATLFDLQSPLIIVLSTLGIAALFNPLRRRIQDFIDQRFYRRKYDAEMALAEFTAVARNETELDSLTSKMVQVTNQSLQPEFSQVWILRKTE